MGTVIYLASVAPLADGALAARLMRRLLPERREKTARLRDAGARRLSLGVGLLLSRALADAGHGASPLCVSAQGKPCFPALPDFHFSLSHSGEMAMCAASDRPLGCDLERGQRYDPRIAARFFHPDEAAWLRALPEERQPDGFLRLWTLKESYMKATGLGFALPMDGFAVSAGEPPLLTRAADTRPWRLRAFREGAYFCALCAEDADGPCPVVRVDFEKLGESE